MNKEDIKQREMVEEVEAQQRERVTNTRKNVKK